MGASIADKQVDYMQHCLLSKCLPAFVVLLLCLHEVNVRMHMPIDRKQEGDVCFVGTNVCA